MVCAVHLIIKQIYFDTFRVLYQVCRLFQLLFPVNLHRVAHLFCDYPSILAQTVDRIRVGRDLVLYGGLYSYHVHRMDLHKWDQVVRYSSKLFVLKAHFIRSTEMRVAPHSGLVLHSRLLDTILK